ncbi:MAG TPA: hypothetical protein VFO39_22055 [Candidatus Sulfotelmatobacter sp.]|nr:hypothetical protein [Candidatus Sulfotelmatobacter sp.]
MAYEYFKDLSLTEEQTAKLRSLGVRTAASLLSRVEQPTEGLLKFLGDTLLTYLREKLPALISEEEKQQLASLPAFRGKFGALLPPKESTPSQQKAAAERRDGLMRQIRMIRESGASSSESQAKLKDLEDSLREELKSAF